MNDVNAGERAFWSEAPGERWSALADRLDHQMSGILDALIGIAAPARREDAIDIGCGAGALSAALADRVGQMGSVLGLDISPPLLAKARERLAGVSQVRLVEADAQTHLFPPESADLVTSRFGVMFFDDPVAAFANMRKALRPGGRLAVAAWAPFDVNPWFKLPAAAGRGHFGLEAGPALDDRTGPFGLAGTERALTILRDAGFGAAAVETRDIDLLVAGDAMEAATLASEVGPISRMMREQGGTAEDLSAIRAALAKDFAAFETGAETRVPGRVHFYTARRD